MKEIWGLIVLVIVYTLVAVWFGMYLQMRYDNYVLPKFTEAAWNKGCDSCLQFQKAQEERDQLQGVPEHPKAI